MEPEFQTNRELLREALNKLQKIDTSVEVLKTKQEYNDKNFDRLDKHISNETKNKWVERVVNAVIAFIGGAGTHYGMK